MFDPVRICEILNDERVDYVIVGGFASVVHGSPLPTQDIDVVPRECARGRSRRGYIGGDCGIIESKRAANRPKDQMALPYLESLRDQIENL